MFIGVERDTFEFLEKFLKYKRTLLSYRTMFTSWNVDFF